MKLEECKNCYYNGREKCLYYNKEYEKLNIKKCIEGFIDPYEYNNQVNVGELCKTCHYYETNQCMGNELAKENCLMER